MTRKNLAKANYEYWKRSEWDELWKAYGSASTAKYRAWERCKQLMYELGGHGLRVISKNSFIFTAGFTFADPDTGVEKFMYITPSYDTAVEV